MPQYVCVCVCVCQRTVPSLGVLLGSSIPGAGDIRLVGGSSLEGRVEIYNSGEWSTVCASKFSDADARVVCRQLGLSRSNANATNAILYGRVSGQVLAVNITCKGTEFRLEYCSTDDPGIGTCGYNEYVAVSCAVPSSSEFPRDGDIRLVDGPSSAEGRVQIYHNGLWGTVCDNRFSDSDAKVVCRQLEHPTSASKARGGAYYGPGIGPIWLDEVACYGSEARLSQCTHGGWRNTDCYHSTDAGGVCELYMKQFKSVYDLLCFSVLQVDQVRTICTFSSAIMIHVLSASDENSACFYNCWSDSRFCCYRDLRYCGRCHMVPSKDQKFKAVFYVRDVF
jgi:deleted-in-malignant-brain-tumors protein 1